MSAFIQEHGLLFGWLTVIGQILLFTVVLLLSLAFLLLMDRKVWAAVMMRKGPNVVGPFGLLQSFADFGKFLLKEIIRRVVVRSIMRDGIKKPSDNARQEYRGADNVQHY